MSQTFQRAARTRCSWVRPTLPSRVETNDRTPRTISLCSPGIRMRRVADSPIYDSVEEQGREPARLVGNPQKAATADREQEQLPPSN